MADRIEAFAAALAAAGMAAALVMDPRHVYYLAGTGQPANLLVVPGREPVLFARRFGDLVRRDTQVEHVIDAAGFSAVVREAERIGLDGGPLGMELDVLPAALVARARRAFGDRAVEDCAPLLLAQRARKDPTEIAAMREAVALFDAVHAAMAEHVRPGIAEHELSGEVVRALRRAGHEGVIAQRRWDGRLQPEGAIASGENLLVVSGGPIAITGAGLSRAMPIGASRRRLATGDLVNIDLGLNRAGYHGDMARTYAVGEAPPGLEGHAAAVRACQDACLAAIRPGVSAESIYDAGVRAADELGVADAFMGHGELKGPYVGHAIGLELDEPPVLGPGVRTLLEEGMVLAVEPKLVSPSFGAVSLEDDVVVTASGYELLSPVPRTVFVVDPREGAIPLPTG